MSGLNSSHGSTFVIAEAGVNHNGRVDAAEALVEAAAAAGADAVKFQTFKPETLVSKTAEKARYQKEATGSGESQFEMLARLVLGDDAHRRLVNRCRDRGILFMSSPFSLEDIAYLDRLGLEVFKVPSGEITNLPYLRKIASLGREIILSTGMADMQEIAEALAALVSAGARKDRITVLHCTSAYPAPFPEVNLRAVVTIKKAFSTRVGYSDHTPGIEAPVAAVALGASVIEKHLTLDKGQEGPDHRASLDPGEFAEMVAAVRRIETALGDGVKRPVPSESETRILARKSIVAARKIRKGEVFTNENLTAKRPGGGTSPMRWDEFIGRTAGRNYRPDEPI